MKRCSRCHQADLIDEITGPWTRKQVCPACNTYVETEYCDVMAGGANKNAVKIYKPRVANV
jgi:hypothetical protein